MTFIALWLGSNALLVAWLAYGRYVKWSEVFKSPQRRGWRV